MNSEKNGTIGFSWDIHWKCNYRCPYCWWHGRWGEISKHNHYPGIDKLISVWKRIYDLYGPARIDISGGEPMIYPGFIEFLSALTSYHAITINTNLSADMGGLVYGLKENRDKLRFNATFHPLFADFKEFIKKAVLLRDNNFSIGITYLAWPPQIEDLLDYMAKFADKDFRLSVLTFWGEYNGKRYPESYTEREKEIISPNLGIRSGEDFQLKPVITYGKKCNAGCTYATIHPDGKALRCGGGSWEREDSPLGNIFDPEFKLLDKAILCTSRYCPCNEWAFLLVER
jgi:MoaA/NifB/PqqE/SkfB family radical SAM enzyme